MSFSIRVVLFFLTIFSFYSVNVFGSENSSSMAVFGFGQEQEKIDTRKQRTIDVKNEQWKLRNIRRVRQVKRAYEDYRFGAIEAVGALVRALDNDRDDVIQASYEALRKIGKDALPYLIEKFNKTRIYAVRVKVMMLMARTGEAEIVVPILEQARIGDPRLQADILEALRLINHPKAHSATLRILQARHHDSRAAVDNRIEMLGEKRVFESLGLKWGDIKENLLTVAWRITQYKKATNPTPKQVEDYELLHQMLHRFIAEYDKALGEGAGLKFLKGHGYDKSILEK